MARYKGGLSVQDPIGRLPVPAAIVDLLPIEALLAKEICL